MRDDRDCGIPADQQSRIFTKFFRGDVGATGITGTGLGLAVSREIVEAHGGRIGFDSDPGDRHDLLARAAGPNVRETITDEQEGGGDEAENSACSWRAQLIGILAAGPSQSRSEAGTGPATIRDHDPTGGR